MAPQDPASAGSVEHAAEPFRALHANVRPLLRHALPAQQTSFIGRSLELAELSQLLTAPECRLVTIIGPGGIGKTRLALEAADAVGEAFAEGVAFVSLQTVSDEESVAAAIAVAIGCTLLGQGAVRDQVARFLRPAHMLLVLDNFEHLLGEADWLGELLAEARGLRLLVTSREALNLREEWRYPLAGLGVPDGDANDAEQTEAVRLFVERARQVRRDFAFEPERDGVVQLCCITEGLPLALELAAAWVTTLSCAEIAAEIEQNIAFLATDLRNVPARHRSMQAAFDHSAALLTEAEGRVFRRLAVFRGGFSRDAAEQVAGATLPLLSSLVDKSLVRREADGRLQLHELLRQYADERLHANPEEAGRVYAAHRAFYLAFVTVRFDAMTGGAQRTAIAEIAAELDNIRAAWRGAVAAGNVGALGSAAHTLTVFFDFRARYREGLALLEEGLRIVRAAAPSPLAERILAAMLVDIARFQYRLMQLPAARAALAESEERYARLAGLPPGHMTDPQAWRAILALLDGHYDEAARLGAEVVRRNTADGRLGNVSPAWWVQAAAALWQEDNDTAEEYARLGAEAAIAAGDRWHLAYCRNQQGHIATARGNYAEARRHYEAAFAIRQEFDDPEGMAGALGHLAKLATRQGQWGEAERLYRLSLAMAQDIGDEGILVQALNGLGVTACATGDYAAAGRYIVEGLRLAVEARYMRLILVILASAADWLLQTGRPTEAIGTLALVHAHPASDHETRIRARLLLAAVALPAGAAAVEQSRDQDADPIALATNLMPVLTMPLDIALASPAPAAVSNLAEPLTERELAVLQLIDAGRSNREIAHELFLSVNTVRSYSQQLYGKLGVGSRTQAVARARELGLLS